MILARQDIHDAVRHTGGAAVIREVEPVSFKSAADVGVVGGMGLFGGLRGGVR